MRKPAATHTHTHTHTHTVKRNIKQFEVNISVFLNLYLFMIVTERERCRDTSRGRSRLHAPGADVGFDPGSTRITPWAKGRRQTAAPPRDPIFITFFYTITLQNINN